MKHFYSFCILNCALCIILLSGCNKGIPVEKVHGLVTLDGKPENNVTVSFCPKDGTSRPAIGRTDDKGGFEMLTGGANRNGVMPGTYVITFVKTVLTTPDGKEYIWKDNKSNAGAEPEPVLTKKHLIPKEYGDREKSAFEVVVEKGKNNKYTFDLKSNFP